MEEEEETTAPVRVRLLFADRKLLSKAQRSEGLRRSLVVIRPDLKTVAEFCRDITTRFGLSNGILLSMDGFIIPQCESTLFFRDNDKIRVKCSIGKKEKKAVAIPSNQPETEVIELTNNGRTVSSNGIRLVNNGDYATEKKKKRKRSLPDEISSKKEQKEGERLTLSKKKKLKLVADERPAIMNESKTDIPAVATPSQFHSVNRQSNAPVIVSQRNDQPASISKCTSTRFYGSPNEKNVLGACRGNDNQQSWSAGRISGQARFMSPGAGPSNWQDNGPRIDGSRDRKTSCKSRCGFNRPNARNRASQPWRNSSGFNAMNSPLKIGNSFTTGEAAENVNPREEENSKNQLYFESLDPVPRLPMEGDIIAFRLDITDSLGCPGLSSFRVGEVIVFDPVLMIIFLLPLPEYPTPDWEMSEFEKDMYKEDGSLELDFESLVDLRLVKESRLNTAPKMHKSGKGKSKASNCQDDAGTLLGNDSSVKSVWELGEASNANEATKRGWDTWAPSTSGGGGGAIGPMGHYGSCFGSRDNFSRGRNSNGRDNSNLAWETNLEATNANEGIQAQQNCWDAWEPSTSQAGASQRRMAQNLSSFPSSSDSRGGRRGCGGKYFFNHKFNK